MNLFKPLFIAEISANHLGSLLRAIELVEAAAKAGANAVKFQTYTAETMTLNLATPAFVVEKTHPLWGGRKLYDLYEEACTPWEWHAQLFKKCHELGVIPFSSPFDLSAVEFLETLDVPMYKIASLETGDHRLIRAVAATGKPLIISTGATEMKEIEEFVKVVKDSGDNDLTLLVCTSSYPSDPKDAHLNRIKTLRDRFGLKIGLSDHTLGIGVSIAAIALGATAIEKHLTLRRSDGGADGAFSMEPKEFAILVKEGSAAYQALGNSVWSIQESESESRRLRRSLYVVQDVKSGDFVTHENVKAIRPGGGPAPKYLDDFLGKFFISDVAKGTPLSFELISEKK